MSRISEFAPAKINISLDVLGRLPGGYHEMRMIMQTVSFGDTVELELTGGGEINLASNFGFLPRDEGNIAYRAAKLILERAGSGLGCNIVLHKRTPVCAGLGGGSSDGAAVLRGLNKLMSEPFSCAELEEMAGKLGSDTVFCVAGGTALATGTGTTLEELPPLPECGIVICKPPFAIRTPELFERIDSRRSRLRPDTPGIIAALEAGDIRGIARRMYNVFEDVLPKGCGEIAQLKSELISRGAPGAVMSGTGSALFGIFETPEQAESAAKDMRSLCREVYAAVPAGRLM